MTDGFQTMPGLNVNQKQHSVIFFFFIEHAFGQLGLLKADLSKPVLGPSPFSLTLLLQAQFLHRTPGSKGCAANLQQDKAVSLACLIPDLEALPFPCPSCSLTTFPSEAVGRSLQVLCCPQVPAVGAGPAFAQTRLDFTTGAQSPGQVLSMSGGGLTLSPSSFFMLLRGVWK